MNNMLQDTIDHLDRFLGKPSYQLNTILENKIKIFQADTTVDTYANKEDFLEHEDNIIERTIEEIADNGEIFLKQYGFIINEANLRKALAHVQKDKNLKILPFYNYYEDNTTEIKLKNGIRRYFQELEEKTLIYLIEHKQIWLYLTFNYDSSNVINMGPSTLLFTDKVFTNDMLGNILYDNIEITNKTKHVNTTNFIITNQVFNNLSKTAKQSYQKWLIPDNAFYFIRKPRCWQSTYELELRRMYRSNELDGLNSFLAPFYFEFYQENNLEYVKFILPKVKELLTKYNPEERKVLQNKLFKDIYNYYLTNNYLKNKYELPDIIDKISLNNINHQENLINNKSAKLTNHQPIKLKQEPFAQTLANLTQPITPVKYDTNIYYNYDKLIKDYYSDLFDKTVAKIAYNHDDYYQDYVFENNQETKEYFLKTLKSQHSTIIKQIKTHYFTILTQSNFSLKLPPDNIKNLNYNLSKTKTGIIKKAERYYNYLLISTLDQKSLKEIFQAFLTNLNNNLNKKYEPSFNYQIEQTKIANYNLLLANPIVDYQDLLENTNIEIKQFNEFHFNCQQSNNIINIKNLPIDLNDNKYKHDAYDVQLDFVNDLLDNTIPVSLQHLEIKLKNKYDWYQYNHQLLNNKDQKFLKQLIQKQGR